MTIVQISIYRLYVFVPAPLLYISFPCSCQMYFFYQLLILFSHPPIQGKIILCIWAWVFLGRSLSVPRARSRCSRVFSTLPMLGNPGNEYFKLFICWLKSNNLGWAFEFEKFGKQILNVGSWEHLETIPTVTGTFVQEKFVLMTSGILSKPQRSH